MPIHLKKVQPVSVHHVSIPSPVKSTLVPNGLHGQTGQGVRALVAQPLLLLVNVNERDSVMDSTTKVTSKMAVWPKNFVLIVRTIRLRIVGSQCVPSSSFVTMIREILSIQHPSGRSGHNVVHHVELVLRLEV